MMDDFLPFSILDESDSEDILYCKNCGELLEEQSDMVNHDCPKLSVEHKKDLKMTLTLDKLNHKNKTQNKSSLNKRKHCDTLNQELTEQVFLIKEDTTIKNNYHVKKTLNEKDAKRTKLDINEDKQSSQSENRKKWANKTSTKMKSQKQFVKNKSSKVKIQRLDVNLKGIDDPLCTKLDSFISPKGVLEADTKVNGKSVEMQEKIEPASNRLGPEIKQNPSKIKQNSRKTGSHKHKIMPSVRAEIKGTTNSDNVNIRIEKFQNNEQCSPKMRIEREQSEKDITSTKVTPKSTDNTQTLNSDVVDNTNRQDDVAMHQTLQGEITQASSPHMGGEIEEKQEEKVSEKGGGTKKPLFMTLCDSCGFFVPTEHECAVQNNSNLELFTSVLSTESEDRIPKGTDFVIVEKGASNQDLSVQNFHQINGYLKSGKDSTLEDYNCIQCGESFVSNNIQIKSEEQIFSIGSDLITFFRCEKCTILLSVKDKIKEGFVTCMNVDDFTPLIERKKNKVVCRICGEDLNELEKIKRLSHFVSHAKQIKKQCIICLQPIFTLRKTRTHMRKHKILIDSTNFFRQVKPELSGCHKKPEKINSMTNNDMYSMCNEKTVNRVQSSEGSAAEISRVETGILDHVTTELTNCNQTDKDGNMFRVDLAKNTLICNFPKEGKNKNMSHDTMRKSVGISSSRNESSERSQSVYTYKVDGNNVVPTSETGVPDNRWRGNDRNKLTNSLDKYNLRKGKRKVDYAELDKGLDLASQCTVAPSHVRLSSGYRGRGSNFNGVVPAKYQSDLNRQSIAAATFNTKASLVNRHVTSMSYYHTPPAGNRLMVTMASDNTTPVVQSNTNIIRSNQNYANSLLSSQAYIGDLIQTLDTCPSTEISDQFLQLADGHPVVNTPSSQLNEISSSKNMFDDILTSVGTVRTYPSYHGNNQRPISHGLQEVQTPINHSNSHLLLGNLSQISDDNAPHLQSKSLIHVPQASVVRLIDNSGQVSQTTQGKMSNTSMIDLNNISVPVSATSYPNDLLGQLVQSSGITESLQDGDIFSNYVQDNIPHSSRDIPTSLMSTTHGPQVSHTSVLPNHVSKTLSLSKPLALPQQVALTSSISQPLALPQQVAQTSGISQPLALPQQVAQTSSISQTLSLPQQLAQTLSVSQPLGLPQQVAKTSELINVSVSLPYTSSGSLIQSNMANTTTHEPQTNTGGVPNSLDENFNRIQKLYMQEMPEGMTDEEEIKFLSQMSSGGATPFQIKESSDSDNESTSDKVNYYNHSQNEDENVENCNKVQNEENANCETLNIGIVQNFDEGNPMFVQEEVEVESTYSKGRPLTCRRKKISPKQSEDFKCKLCILTFRRKDLLSKHEELHVTNPHTCWQCCLTFNSAVQYSNHVKDKGNH